MNARQAALSRLAEVRDLVRSGATQHVGRAKRYAKEEGWQASGGRIRGLKPAYPELQKLKESPGQIAKAVDRGKGKVFTRIYRVVYDAMLQAGYKPYRQWRPGRPVIPPHKGRKRCKICKVMHAKGQHRFHGPGSFHATHAFAFGGNPMRKNPRKFPPGYILRLSDIARSNTKWAPAAARLLSRAAHPTEKDWRGVREVIARYGGGKLPAWITKNPRLPLTFSRLFVGAIFEFTGEGMPRGPWRKVSVHQFELADAPGRKYDVLPGARVRTIERGLFAEGPLFNPRRRPRRVIGKLPSKRKGLVRVYGRVLSVQAEKLGPHKHCDAACKRAGHRYTHSFKKGSRVVMSGTADKKTLILHSVR